MTQLHRIFLTYPVLMCFTVDKTTIEKFFKDVKEKLFGKNRRPRRYIFTLVFIFIGTYCYYSKNSASSYTLAFKYYILCIIYVPS